MVEIVVRRGEDEKVVRKEDTFLKIIEVCKKPTLLMLVLVFISCF